MSGNAAHAEMPLVPHMMYPDRPWPRDAAFAGVMGKAVKAYANYSEADPIGMLFALLALMSGAIGSGPTIRAKKNHPLIMQVCLLGEKGFGLKGTATDDMRDLVKLALPDFAGKRVADWTPVSAPDLVFRLADTAVHAEWFPEGVTLEDIQKAEESPLKYLRPRFPMTLVVQEWVNIIRAAAMDANLDVHLRTTWQGDDLEAKLKKGWLRLIAPHLAIIGNTTPTEFFGSLAARSLDGGSLTRLLIAFVHQVKDEDDDDPIPDELANKHAKAIRAGVNYARKAGAVTWSAEARRAWNGPTGIKAQLIGRALASPLLKEFFANRPRVHVPRLAALFALMARRTEIGMEDLNAAWAIMDYAMDSVLFIANMHGERFAHRFAPGMMPTNGNGHVALKMDGDATKARKEVNEYIAKLLKDAGPDGMLISAIQPRVRHVGKYSPEGPADKQAINDSLEAMKQAGHVLIENKPRTVGGSGRTGTRAIWVGPMDTPEKAPESPPERSAPPTPTQLPPLPPVPRQRPAKHPSARRSALPPPKRPARARP